MPNTLLQNTFKSLKCLHQGHDNQPLSYLCISTQCQHTPLLCYLCSLQQHNDHQKILLKIFLNQLLSVQEKSEKIIPLCAQIDTIFSTIKNKLKDYSKNFDNLELIQRTFQSYRTINVSYVMSFYTIIEKVQQLFTTTEECTIIQKLNKFVKNEYFKYFLEIEQQDWVKLNISQNLLQKKIQSLNSILLTIQNLQNTNKLNDTLILNLFPLFEESHKKIKVYFSQDLKPSNMTIISPIQAKMQKTGSQRLIVLQPCLSKSLSVKKWGVKIIKLASWIGVGVCHINEIKKANYMFNYTNTGHGNYLISSNGYSWSSYKKEFNSKFEPFSYTTGDIIHIEYDPKQRIVKFKKQSDSNQPTYQLQVQANDDPVHPQINLTGLNDEVELINF